MQNWVPYVGTITFDSNFDLSKKNKLIERFTVNLAKHLSYREDRRYYIIVAKEYHKVENKNDYEAPHLHFLLWCSKPIAAYRVRSINQYFKDTHGRTQMFRATTLKSQQWDDYIRKDVEVNGNDHLYEMNLEEPIQEFDEDEYLIDMYDDL